MKNVICLVVFVFIGFNSIYAQPVNDLIGDVVLPSPESASLGKYGDIPVGNPTGTPSIGVPLLTINEGKLSLPISLSYHGSGIRVAETSSWVGLGWSLSAGGSISRTVLGRPDESVDGYFNSSFLFNQPNAYCSTTEDVEPDIFSFSMPGGSGKFFIDKGKVIRLIDQTKQVKIELIESVGGVVFAGFILTTADGTRYIFGEHDGNSARETMNANNIDVGINAWKLMRMESFDSNYHIDFTYTTEQYSYKSLTNCKYVFSNIGNNAVSEIQCPFNGVDPGMEDYKYNIQNVTGLRLSGITVGSGTKAISFVANTAREDLSTVSNTNRLDEIRYTTGSFCKKFVFGYSYFEDPSVPNNYAYAKRLQLTQVQEKSCDDSESIPPYKFTYESPTNPNGSQFMPHRLSKEIDHWGFYNGKSANNSLDVLVPATELFTGTTYQSYGCADRSTDMDLVKYGTLSQIEYPTGGTTNFEFESHKISGVGSTNPIIVFSNLATCGTLGPSCCGMLSDESNPFSFTNANQINNATFDLSITEPVPSCNATQPFARVEAYEGNTLIGSYTLPLASGQMTSSVTGVSLSVLEVSGTFTVNNNYTLKVVSSEGRANLGLQFTDPQNMNVAVGGLRIKQITNHDGANTSNDIVKNYSYLLTDEMTSSGIVLTTPTYGASATGIQVSTNCPAPPADNHILEWNGTSMTPLSEYEGRHMVYTRVTESISGNGKVVSTYNVDPNPYPTIYNLSLPAGVYIPSGNVIDFVTPPRQYSWANGELLSRVSYPDQSTTPIREEHFNRSNLSGYQSATGDVFKSRVFSCTTCENTNYNYLALQAYKPRTGWYLLDNKTTIQDGITTVESYTYDSGLDYYNPKSVSITNSDGTVYLTEYDYPHDQYTGTDPCASPTSTSQKMVCQNRIVPIETRQFAGGTLVDGTRTNFGYLGQGPYPASIDGYEWPSQGTASWVTQADINSYDTQGNPTQITLEGWSPVNLTYTNSGQIKTKSFEMYDWTYDYYDSDGTDLIQKVTNIDAIKQTYTYDNLIRLSQTVNRQATVAGVTTGIVYSYGTQNSVRSTTDFNGDYDIDTEKVFDGLGREIKIIQHNHGTNGAGNAETITSYDYVGRVATITDPTGFVTTNNYFADPLNRLQSTTTNTGLGGSSYNYTNGTTPLSNISNVYKVETTDLDGRKSISYTDIMGRTVATSQGEGSTLAHTIMEYDGKHRVVKVHPPDGYNNAGLTYSYTYDGDDNIEQKIIPDMGDMNYRYDDRNLLIAMNDPNIASNKGWLATNNDVYGRPLIVGFGSETGNVTSQLIRNYYDGDDGDNAIGSGAQIGRMHRKVVNILEGYDKGSYDISTLYTFDNAGRLQTENSTGYHIGTSVNRSYTYNGGDSPLTITKAANGENSLTTYTYDPEGRLLTSNFSDGNSSKQISAIQGYSLRDELTQKQVGQAETCTYSYNGNGWLTGINIGQPAVGSSLITDCPTIDPTPVNNSIFSMTLTYNGGGSPQLNGNIAQQRWKVSDRDEMVVDYVYDFLNRINSSTTSDNLYNTTYTYADARGNLDNVTREGLINNGACFEEVSIDNLDYSYVSNSNKISSITDSALNEVDCPDTYHVEGPVDQSGIWAAELELSSDAVVHGDMQSTMQAGEEVELQAGFEFDSDGTGTFLAHTEDCATASPNLATGDGSAAGFVGNGGTYGYDANGNITTDPNKGFTFEYNHLNLPYLAEKDASNKIEWLYTAEGKQIQKKVTAEGSPSDKDYFDEFEFNEGSLDAIYHAEGRVAVVNGTREYQYFLKDHLGNTRVAFRVNGGQKEIIQESHYYPFGMEWSGPWVDNPDTENDYLYNGKELNKDLALNLSNYGARFYDPAIGRFTSVDPLASDYAPWTPYHYVHNNPILLTDPTGMSADTLKVGYVLTGPGLYHTNIINVDNETGEEEVIVEGFPENEISDPIKLLKDGWGNLEREEKTDPSDISEENKDVLEIPEGMTEAEFKAEIECQASCYDNAVPYDPLPKKNNGEGNSNSLIGSVLRASGSNYKQSKKAPGFNVNVLPGNRSAKKPKKTKSNPTFRRFGEN